MSNIPSTADLLAGGAPAAKFPTVGTTVKGKVINAEVTQQTDYATGEVKTWDDGSPRLQIVITVQTDERDPDIPNDEGERRIFVKGQMLQALRSALRAVGARDITPGDTIAVQYTGDGEAKRGMNPPKLYAVQVKKGSPVADLLSGQDTTAPPTDLL